MKTSAGILAYKFKEDRLQVFLVHPGGPFWKNKDDSSWSIPKGEYTDEAPLQAAVREFKEETGITIDGPFIALEPVKMKSGKLISAWASQQNIDPDAIHSNLFEMEWPPKSRKLQSFPEIDRGEWFSAEVALAKINTAQQSFITDLASILKATKAIDLLND